MIESKMDDYFESHKNDLSSCEFLIPDVLDTIIRSKEEKIKVIKTESKWYGVTYREDLDTIKNAIHKLIEKGEYHNNLWN